MEIKKNGFVYVWLNKTNNRKYIGYHVGSVGDGYVSSSHNINFWNDFENDEMEWERTIVFTGDSNTSLEYEQKLLEEIDLSSDEYYNNARGSKIIFTDEVRKKMSISGKKRWEKATKHERELHGKKISELKIGVPRSEETIQKLRDYYNNDNFIGIHHKDVAAEIYEKIAESCTGKKRGDEFKKEQSLRFSGEKNPMYGKKHTEEFKEDRRKHMLENNPGKNKSEETKKRISEAKKGTPSKTKGIPREVVTCPHCGKTGGVGIMYRWHFNNCKNK